MHLERYAFSSHLPAYFVSVFLKFLCILSMEASGSLQKKKAGDKKPEKKRNKEKTLDSELQGRDTSGYICLVNLR